MGCFNTRTPGGQELGGLTLLGFLACLQLKYRIVLGLSASLQRGSLQTTSDHYNGLMETLIAALLVSMVVTLMMVMATLTVTIVV